jgi:predicted esterase
LGRPGIAYRAPQAKGSSWYPRSFLAPVDDNEPWLSSALALVVDIVDGLTHDGFPPHRVALLGFSQGGCLALEFAARHARRYGAVIGLSAGLIGAELREYAGSLDGTPVLLGCSDIDAHIPLARVHESARRLGAMGAAVTERIYEGMGHTINDDEIRRTRQLLDELVGASA